MRAIFLAMATTATLGCRRALSAVAQRLVGSSLRSMQRRTARAPRMSRVRGYASPRLLMPSSRARPPPGGVLARHQAKPGGQTATVLQQLRILVNAGQQRGGDLSAKAGDGPQGACLGIALGDLLDLVIVVGDPLIEETQLLG